MSYLNLMIRGKTNPFPKFQNYHVKFLNWDNDYELGHIEQ